MRQTLSFYSGSKTKLSKITSVSSQQNRTILSLPKQDQPNSLFLLNNTYCSLWENRRICSKVLDFFAKA